MCKGKCVIARVCVYLRFCVRNCVCKGACVIVRVSVGDCAFVCICGF